MAYVAWSVVFGEQPSAAKWNILGTNDASFNDGTGIGAGVITPVKRAGGFKIAGITVAGTGSLAVTGVGFQPKFLEIYTLPATASTVMETGYGATDGTAQFSTATRADQDSSDASVQSNTTGCLLAITTNAITLVAASITSFDTDGFTLNVTVRDGSRTFRYMAFG